MSGVIGDTTFGCSCEDCVRQRGGMVPDGAVERAEALLRRFLTPEQIEDWEKNQQITVIGSKGGEFRLTPSQSGYHRSVVRKKGFRSYRSLGIAVWPIRLNIAADWVLALKLYLEADENNVVSTGCHGDVAWDHVSDGLNMPYATDPF